MDELPMMITGICEEVITRMIRPVLERLGPLEGANIGVMPVDMDWKIKSR